MPTHSVCKIWLHLIWGTRRRIPYLTGDSAKVVRTLLTQHAKELGLNIRTVYVNADHVHMLIRWYPDTSLSDAIGKLKGRSSRIISRDRIASADFRWAVGYGAFSVSSWDVDHISGYIDGQEAHHRRKPLAEMIEDLLREIETEGDDTDGSSPG